MISPSSPSVQVTSVTCAPSAAYLAIVAPVPIDSSSGCACTSSSRLAKVMVASLRARRERVREQAGGIVAYATDADLTVAVFGWSGRVFTIDLTQAEAAAHEVMVPGPVLDPRPDPAGKRLAYVRAGALRVASLADPA